MIEDFDIANFIVGCFAGAYTYFGINHFNDHLKKRDKERDASKKIKFYKNNFNQKEESPEKIIVVFNELYSYSFLVSQENKFEYAKLVIDLVGDSLENLIKNKDLNKYYYLNTDSNFSIGSNYNSIKTLSNFYKEEKLKEK